MDGVGCVLKRTPDRQAAQAVTTAVVSLHRNDRGTPSVILTKIMAHDIDEMSRTMKIVLLRRP